MHYKIHHTIIEAVANIYKDDFTEIQFGDIEKKMDITSGIRQECTGSTILFKLITYMIMTRLNETGTGYIDEQITLKSLYFADDALLLSHLLEDARNNLAIIIEVSREFGLEINKEKSDIMIFNMKEQPESINKLLQSTNRDNRTEGSQNGKHHLQCYRKELQQIINWKNILEMYSTPRHFV